jgi:hypothetical protein
MHDYPHDVELGLVDRDEIEPSQILRCGCEVHPSETTHDVDDCCERQADDLAAREEEVR